MKITFSSAGLLQLMVLYLILSLPFLFVSALPAFADSNCPAVTSSALPDTSGTVTIQLTNNRSATDNGEVELAYLDTSVSTDNPTLEGNHLFFHAINGNSWLDGFDGVNLIAGTLTYTATLNNPTHLTSLDVNVSQFNGTWCTTTLTLTRSTSPTPTPTPPSQPTSTQALSNTTINEGNTYTANGSFTDPDSTSWTATVDYGDGSGAQPLTLSGTNFSLSHVYKDNGTYTVTVSVTDKQGATGTGTATVTVNNVAPTVGTITAAVNPVQVNTATTASANFTDPGGNDTHTASWNWGDGNTTTGTVTESNGSGSVSDSHTYTSAGVYQISLTVTDKDGGAGTQIFQYLSVYNPTSQGLFSAGQHFTSPAGAYAQNTSLTGMVRFGLSYKYQGTMPVGTRQFSMDFNTANFH